MDQLVSGAFAQAFSIVIKMAGGIFLIPLIIRNYNHGDVALWYLLNAGIGFASLLEFGFGPSVSRFFAYTLADSNSNFSGIKHLNLRPNAVDVFRAFSKIYFYLTLIVLVGAGGLGYAYFSSLPWTEETTSKPTILWLIVSASCAINLIATALNNILIGQMRVKRAAAISTTAQVVYLCSAILVISYDKALIWVIACHLAGAVTNLTIHLVAHKHLIISALREREEASELPAIISAIWSPSWRMGVVLFGSFLIQQSSTLLIGRFQAAGEVAKYGLSLQIFSAITAISTVFNRTSLPLLSRAFAEKNSTQIKRLIVLSTSITAIVFLSSSMSLLFFAEPLFAIIGSRISPPSSGMLCFMSLYLFLEVNHSTSAAIISAKNTVPFVKASIFSGLAIVIMSWLTLKYTTLGLWGPMLTQAFVQAAYNNWFWPRQVVKENGIVVSTDFKIIMVELNREMRRFIK